MEFQYDPQRRRHVEGWNIIIYDGEDKIGLTEDEYDRIAFDFIMNGMINEAKRCYIRSIAQGSVRAMSELGKLYEKEGNLAEAYKWYLEASLADDVKGLKNLSRLYEKGIYVEQSFSRAEKLLRYAESIEVGDDLITPP